MNEKQPNMSVKSYNPDQNWSHQEQANASVDPNEEEMIEILPNDKSDEFTERKRKNNDHSEAKKAKVSKQSNDERTQDATEHSPFMANPPTAISSPFQTFTDRVPSATVTANTADAGIEPSANEQQNASIFSVVGKPRQEMDSNLLESTPEDSPSSVVQENIALTNDEISSTENADNNEDDNVITVQSPKRPQQKKEGIEINKEEGPASVESEIMTIPSKDSSQVSEGETAGKQGEDISSASTSAPPGMKYYLSQKYCHVIATFITHFLLVCLSLLHNLEKKSSVFIFLTLYLTFLPLFPSCSV